MSNEQPRVSIGMPVYNGENFLKEALDSILAQTFENFELIISDNASTDSTEEICQEYAAKDKRISYHRNEQNIGGCRNFNRVFELSNSEYFKWATHDDLCAPELLEQCVEALDKRSSVVLAYPRTVIIDEQGREVERYFRSLDINSPRPHERFKRYHDCLRECWGKGWWVWTPLHGVIRTRALKMTPLLGSYISSDTVLLSELALLGEFYEVPEHLFFKRKHSQSSMDASRDNSNKLNYDKLILWFQPTKKNKFIFPHWRLFLESIMSINRVQISRREKLYSHFELRKYLRFNRRRLVEELMMNFARFLNIYTNDFVR